MADVSYIVRVIEEMELERSESWDAVWQSIAYYLRPDQRSFDYPGLTSAYSQGSNARRANVYDDTALYASNTLASTLISLVFNPETKWFGLEREDGKKLSQTERRWVQDAQDKVLGYLLRPETNFYQSLDEFMKDYVDFGNGYMYAEATTKRIGRAEVELLRFCAKPIQMMYARQNDFGDWDIIAAKHMLTAHQYYSKFSKQDGAYMPKEVTNQLKTGKNSQLDTIEVWHLVMPRENSVYGGMATKKPWASIWLHRKDSKIIYESGYDYFPYVYGRFRVLSEENYGRGPGADTLPNIQMVNEMKKHTIRSAENLTEPAVAYPEGLFGQNGHADLSPRAHNTYDPFVFDQLNLREPIQSLTLNNRPDIGLEMIQDVQQDISRSYFIDKVQMPQKAAEVKEIEVLEGKQERMQGMVPQLVRLYSEVAVPTIRLVLDYLIENNYVEKAPEGLEIPKLTFASPLSRAMKMADILTLQRLFSQIILPMAQVDPTILDSYNLSALPEFLNDKANLPVELGRTPEQVQQLREQRQQQQQLLEQTQALQNAGRGIESLAKADEAQARARSL